MFREHIPSLTFMVYTRWHFVGFVLGTLHDTSMYNIIILESVIVIEMQPNGMLKINLKFK